MPFWLLKTCSAVPASDEIARRYLFVAATRCSTDDGIAAKQNLSSDASAFQQMAEAS
jgi:hypothetical protein